MREVYVMRGGALVPRAQAAPLNTPAAAFHVMPDIAPFVTQDGAPIGSRSTLRAYEQRTGTKQVGNDYGSIAQSIRDRMNGEA